MKSDELLIQDVTLARCGEVVDNRSHTSGDKLTQVNVIEFTIEKTVTCVVDRENGVVIDIETHKVWNIPRRDESNRIVDDVVFGQLYPIMFMNKNWDEISYMYQLSLKARAKKIYQRYLEEKMAAENNKVKTKTKEN